MNNYIFLFAALASLYAFSAAAPIEISGDTNLKSIIRKARKSQGGKCKCQEIVVEADTVVVKNAKVEAEEISIETVEEVKTEADQVNVENIEESKSEVKESHVGTIEQSKAEIKEVKVDNIEEAKDTKII